MVAAAACFAYGAPARELGRSFITALPSEFATGLLTASVAFTYGISGWRSVGLAAVILFVFLYILRASVQSQERGEELDKRTERLASLQMGLLSTVLQTLSMRDAMTARHSTAVARYARHRRGDAGLDEREQDLIHTAALLHDIGKFILPDSVLFAERKLTDEEWELIKLHPEQGAKLVERIDGYGPVAKIVLHHHERFTRRRLSGRHAGEDIPLGSRIISVADTYDVMTSRDSYRRPVSSEAALAELRRVAGTQLDPQVVEVFERMILEARRGLQPRRRVGLRGRAGLREAGRRLRAAPPRRRGLDVRRIQAWREPAVNENERLMALARQRGLSVPYGIFQPMLSSFLSRAARQGGVSER